MRVAIIPAVAECPSPADAAVIRAAATGSLFNRALWKKSLIEARLLLAGCVALMFAFQWIFVWITSLVKLGALRVFLNELPPELQALAGVPVDQVATDAGRISMAYIDPVVILLAAIWGIARGSDSVSGEINRGTMEMLLAQPVRRAVVLLTPTVITIGGAVLLALAAWLGTCAGLATVTLSEPVTPWPFVPAATNLFALIFFVAGTTTFLSSWDSYRWRTIGLMGSFYILSLVLEVMGKSVSSLAWVRNFTFLGMYEPQLLVSKYLKQPDEVWQVTMQYNLTLVGLGLAGFAAALVIFCRRDVPAPL